MKSSVILNNLLSLIELNQNLLLFCLQFVAKKEMLNVPVTAVLSLLPEVAVSEIDHAYLVQTVKMICFLLL